MDTPSAEARLVRVGDYLIERLRDHGVGHVFGVPGDFVLGFMQKLEQSPLTLVNTCDEQGAGFAADAYARIHGLGVVCVTYGVGGLKLANSTGQAYAEESPVVVISGAPGLAERARHPLLHHKVRAYDTQLRVFERLTIASTLLGDPETACREIDRVLAMAVRHKRPVYIELPRDMVETEVVAHGTPALPDNSTDPPVLAAALAEATATIAAAERPVIVLGVEVQRFGLTDAALRFIERTNIPTAVTLLDKSSIGERHPSFIGVYAGAMGREEVRSYVEESDCVILLGALLTDVNLGGFTGHLDPARCIHATRGRLAVGYHIYEHVRLADVVNGLAGADLPRRDPHDTPRPSEIAPVIDSDPEARITVAGLFGRLATSLTDETIVIADPGDALFGAADLPIPRSVGFLAPAYYASLGFAVPAAIGAQLAAPERRPLVLVGDGAFQMTGMELSTAARYGLSPIVVVLNNGGYATERLMCDGRFNDVLPWDYSRLPDLFGAGRAFLVETFGDLDQALTAAATVTDTFCLLDVRLDPADVSPALRRMASGLGALTTGARGAS